MCKKNARATSGICRRPCTSCAFRYAVGLLWLAFLALMGTVGAEAQTPVDTLHLRLPLDSLRHRLAIINWQGSGDSIVARDTVMVLLPITQIMAAEEKKVKKLTHADSLKLARRARRDSIRLERLGIPAWDVKTNLLFWGVVAPNIQVEVPLGKNRWSLEAEYFVPWFIWAGNTHAHQFHNLGLELRYWPGKRDRRRWLEGWHIGLAAAVGYYDMEWKKSDGYQGEHLNTYLNIGYQFRWGRHWGMDMSLGLGAMVTKYRHYYGGSVYPEEHLEPWDKHLIWHHSGHYVWPGPCHASISLVYFFNKKKVPLCDFATIY